MSSTIAEVPSLLHVLPGRVRVHIPEWLGQERRKIETTLWGVQGVSGMQASALTGNVLIYFDPCVTNEQALLDVIRRLTFDTTAPPEEEPASPPVIREKQGKIIRARIAVRGLDRNPHLARQVVELLERRPGVRATASLLTGRVLVEFAEHEAVLDELVADITGMELPQLPGEDRPASPLDLGPLIQSAIRTFGSTLGLGLLTVRRFLGVEESPPGASGALRISSIIGILQSIPPIRYGLRRLFGRTGADLLINVPSIITLVIAGSSLGLAMVASESLYLLTEILARRKAWRRYEGQVKNAPPLRPAAVLHLEAGERSSLAASVIEGTGTAIGRDSLPLPVFPSSVIPPGACLSGGPFTVKLLSDETFQPFEPVLHSAPMASVLYSRYLQIVSPLSLLYAAGTALARRSFDQTLASLLLLNPRVAAVGLDAADVGAAARVMRAGVTIVGTRKNRSIRRPGFVLLDGARVLTNGLEFSHALTLTSNYDAPTLLALATGVSVAARSPWGRIFKTAASVSATDGSFDGKVARAVFKGIRYTLGPIEDWILVPEASTLRQRGNYVLALHQEGDQRPLGIFALCSRLASGVSELVQRCQRYGVPLVMLTAGDQIVAQEIARRAGVALIDGDNALDVIREQQANGLYVAFISDNAEAAAAFEACDLAIGLIDEHSCLAARADLLAPDLLAVAAIIEAGVRRDATVRDSVGLSLIANIFGVVSGFRQVPQLALASRVGYIAGLVAMVDGWLRLRGGKRPEPAISRLVDPYPERWGQMDSASVYQALRSSPEGLTSAGAARRQRGAAPRIQRHKQLAMLLDQFRSPLIGILAVGAGLSAFLGSIVDAVIISGTILVSVAVNLWQENMATQTTEMLHRLEAPTARVLRDGQVKSIPSNAVVSGDILVLSPGDRVAADARIVKARGLEVDEAALTGESLPVPKIANGEIDASRVVLAGSDITSGTARAVVVAVGNQTRMGATVAALATDKEETSPLGVRLARMLRVFLPVSVLGGATVIAAGLFWGRPLTILLATGATIALAGAPEGLPLLAKVGETGVARRLAARNGLVRRLSAVEALGRVDIACTDKTGTLTRGRLALSMVANIDHETKVQGKLSADLQQVLLTAALACPHPDAPDAKSHPTDVAIIQGAIDAGLSKQIHVSHEEELPFDPARSFHATFAQGHLCVKGSPEAMIPHCRWVMQHGEKVGLDEDMQNKLLASTKHLAGRGLRLLLVAEGPADTPIDNPEGLTVLGFVGISDLLRATARVAVCRCREAGVRVIMITGDHPDTARAIAQESGLLDSGDEILTGTDLAELNNGELAQRLEHASVIARATPLDKLRIIECLRSKGHTVAMTGDGVNDAPALRLADVGVAMGVGSTEVARQTADVVITNDDFSTLVETFVEGRSFWRNIRRSLGLLLGGNLGELGLVVAASLMGLDTPLTTRQILAVNMITDILPSLAVALQPPEHRNLAGLSREGAAALDEPLRFDITKRAIISAVPSFVSYLIMRRSGVAQARTVAFASIVATQLAQTLDAGRSEGSFTGSVFAAVAGSAGALLAILTVPPLRTFFNLAVLSPFGWLLIGAGALTALLLCQIFALYRSHVVKTPKLAV
jgi:cation-transporting ATPase I